MLCLSFPRLAALTEHTVAQEAPPAAYAVTHSTRRQYFAKKKQMSQSKCVKQQIQQIQPVNDKAAVYDVLTQLCFGAGRALTCTSAAASAAP